MFTVKNNGNINTNLKIKYNNDNLKLGVTKYVKNNIIITGNFFKENNLIIKSFENNNLKYKSLDKTIKIISLKFIKKNYFLGLINNDNCEYKLVKIDGSGKYTFFTINQYDDFYKNIYRTIKNSIINDYSFDSSRMNLVSFIIIGCNIHFFIQYINNKNNKNLIFIITSKLNFKKFTISSNFYLNSIYNIHKSIYDEINNVEKIILQDVIINDKINESILLFNDDDEKSYMFKLKYFKDLFYFGSALYLMKIKELDEINNYIDGVYKSITYLDKKNILLIGYANDVNDNDSMSYSCDSLINNKLSNNTIILSYKKLKK